MHAIEVQRSNIEKFLENYPHLLQGNSGKRIPSTEVFEVLRKAGDQEPEELARLPNVAKERMMDAIARTENPSCYRLSFIPPNVNPAHRSLVAVHGELVEKKVRKQLTGFGEGLIPPSVLDRVTFALDMPESLGTGQVRLLVKPADGVELTAQQRRLIEENLAPAISRVNNEIAEETGETIRYTSGNVQFY